MREKHLDFIQRPKLNTIMQFAQFAIMQLIFMYKMSDIFITV